ncbi:MAG: helix-turn-helix domain-containing protein [Caldimonas sp.]
MPASRYSTEDVASRESFSYWHDLICDVFINLDCTATQERAFAGTIHTQALGDVELSKMEAGGMRLTRTSGHIARAADDDFLIVLQDSGKMHVDQSSRFSTLQRGDCALFDSAQPYVACLADSFSHIVLKVPRRLMRSRYGPVEAFSGVRIPGDRGMGRVASRFLQSLPEVLPSLDDASQSRLASISLDLVSAAIAECQVAGRPSETTTRVARRIQIKDFIESHLGDCELSLKNIGAALHVSTRYLNDVFEQEGTSVARHIWNRRLERCHLILQDPAQAGRSISSVAFGLGFNDLSHFGRAFRARYGVSPRDFRGAALTAVRA